MNEREFAFQSDADQTVLQGTVWMPSSEPVAIVQIAHGLAEHHKRYARLAAALVDAGFGVYAYDHRGHGKSIADGAVPGDFGAAGWDGLVNDLVQLTRQIKSEHPDVPVILLGHSMGSFAAQHYLLDHHDLINACVLSGSSDMPSLAQAAMAGTDLSFAALNAAFEPARTPFDWLSRDDAEVDRYIADPLCGFDAPPETAMAMMMPAMRIAEPSPFAAVRDDLPILIISGDADPLCGGGAYLQTLKERLGGSDMSDVTLNLYPDARHELFNETNRDAITDDLIAWSSDAVKVTR